MYYSCFTATVHSPRIFFFNWYLLFSSQSLSTLSVIEEFLSKCDVPFYPGRVTDPLKPVRWAKNKSYFSKEKMYKIKCVLEICKGTYMYHRGALCPLFQDQTFGPFGGRNNWEPGEKPSQQDDNQQQNQLTKGLNLNLAHTGWRQVLSALPIPSSSAKTQNCMLILLRDFHPNLLPIYESFEESSCCTDFFFYSFDVN